MQSQVFYETKEFKIISSQESFAVFKSKRTDNQIPYCWPQVDNVRLQYTISQYAEKLDFPMHKSLFLWIFVIRFIKLLGFCQPITVIAFESS